MTTQIGIDIVEIDRFAQTDKERFMERCFTQREREYLQGKGPQSKAGLFAAKEATVKALGTGFRAFWPCDVEIDHDALGKPFVLLHGKAAQFAKMQNIIRITVSISHDRHTAVAVALLESGRTGRYARRDRRSNARHRGLRG